MICPSCGSNIPDGSEVCPACHADLAVTRVMPRLTGTFCPTCGALVPAGSACCPKCGMPVGTDARTPSREVREPSDPGRTNTLPRIESAIPSEPSASGDAYPDDRLPRTKVIVTATLASLLVVGGAALAITHPWDPSATDMRATTPADTSQAGFPGTVSALRGQDSQTVSQTVVSGDDATLAALEQAWASLGDLSGRTDENERSFKDKAVSGSSSERSAGKAQAQQIAIEVSNLLDQIGEIDVTSGTYTDQRQNLVTLGNWLRNRLDALVAGWTRSAASDDPATEADRIEQPVESQRQANGKTSYANLFADSYDSFKPTRA